MYVMDFENNGGWYTGSISGPDLWHRTLVDSWSGEYAMGCFNNHTCYYENNMNFNYMIFNETFSMEGAIDMIMTFYCKYVTEDSDDYWGVVLYDPKTDNFFDNGSFYGYQPTWRNYYVNIKSAYDYYYRLGYFRNNDGSRSYDFRIGFVFIRSDSSGFINPEAEANEVYWSGIFIDDVSISRLTTNDPPNMPVIPSGPDTGQIGKSYDFSTLTTDPDGDQIKYGWDWDGDRIVDEWTGWYASGITVFFSHMWISTGAYYVQVMATDENGVSSDFSHPKMVVMTHQPNKPVTPVGDTEGKFGNSYWYSTSTIDPDGEQLYYLWDWGDGTQSEWLGRYRSGDNCRISHTWDSEGTYNIKVKAKDIHGVESDWSEPLSVAMPYSYNKPILSYLEVIWQRFPNAFPILRQLTEY